MNIKIYGCSLKSDVEDKYDGFINFVYAHGMLEEYNEYDLVYTTDKNLKLIEDSDNCILDVIYVAVDGKEFPAILYFWHYDCPFEGCSRRAYQHGLICDINDKEANEYAQKKFSERARYL